MVLAVAAALQSCLDWDLPGTDVAGIAPTPEGWGEASGLLRETWSFVEDHYVEGLDDVDRRRLAEGAAAGMLESLGDRYSRYVPPSRSDIEWQDAAGAFGGVGVVVEPAQDSLLVVSVTAGGPADGEGIEPGDLVTAADGVSFSSLGYEEAVGKVRGEVGTPVALDVYRPGDGRQFQVTVVRDVVRIPVLGRVELVAPGIGYVQITEFIRTTKDRVAEAVAGLVAEGATALVLDLRGNPGGEMQSSLEVADLFIAEGAVVRLRFRERVETYTATAGHPWEELQLAVLVDRFSASASEILAGALQDHGRAVVIGERTFGKGLVQHAQELIGGGSVLLTSAVYETPSGAPVHGEGIEPDVPYSAFSADDPEVAALLSEAEELQTRLREIRASLDRRIADLGLALAIREIESRRAPPAT